MKGFVCIHSALKVELKFIATWSWEETTSIDSVLRFLVELAYKLLPAVVFKVTAPTSPAIEEKVNGGQKLSTASQSCLLGVLGYVDLFVRSRALNCFRH